MKLKLLLAAAIPLLLLAACEKEDAGGEDGGGQTTPVPVIFTANIQAEASTRVTVNNGWTGLADNRIAIAADGVMKEYAVNDLGEITSESPFYWEVGKESMQVDAWYPFNDGVKPETITVSADQSVPANYEASDYLEVAAATITPQKSTLNFTHRTAKVVCTLTSSVDDTKTARVILHNLAGVDSGTSITATDKHRALLVPQTVLAGTEFIEVQSDRVGKYAYMLKEDLELQPGRLYQIDITITASGIDAVFTESSSWTADVEVPGVDSPGANPGSEGDGWKGDGESSDGNSPDVTPGDNNSGWTGDGEQSDGNSSETNPGSGNGNWTGGNESSTGNSSETNPGNGNGNWTGDNESSTGDSSETNSDNGNGSWTGENETPDGDSTEAKPDNGNGSWTGQKEEVTASETSPTGGEE